MQARQRAARCGGGRQGNRGRDAEIPAIAFSPLPAFLSKEIELQCAGKLREDLLFDNRADHLWLPYSTFGRSAHAVLRLRSTEPSFPEVALHDLRHAVAGLAVGAGGKVKPYGECPDTPLPP